MLSDGKIPKNVPNWWNPYAPNLGQEDPQKRQRVANIIKLVFVVITMLGGAILALTVNVLVRNRYEGEPSAFGGSVAGSDHATTSED